MSLKLKRSLPLMLLFASLLVLLALIGNFPILAY